MTRTLVAVVCLLGLAGCFRRSPAPIIEPEPTITITSTAAAATPTVTTTLPPEPPEPPTGPKSRSWQRAEPWK